MAKPVKVRGIKCAPERISGPWKIGYAIDLHTISSVPDGGGGFLTERTELGQLIYDLKYQRKKNNATKVAAVLSEWIRRKYKPEKIDGLVSAPPSTSRQFQPVPAIVKRMSETLSIPNVTNKLKKTRATTSLKNILDPNERKKQLDGAYAFDNSKGYRTILLVDDLYRSGATAREITQTIKAAGVKHVVLIAATKTRVNR